MSRSRRRARLRNGKAPGRGARRAYCAGVALGRADADRPGRPFVTRPRDRTRGQAQGGDRLPASRRNSSARGSSAEQGGSRSNAFPMQSDRPSTILKGFKHIITVETTEPIAFFSYPDKPSLLKSPGTQCSFAGRNGRGRCAGLEMLVEAVGATNTAAVLQHAFGRDAADWRTRTRQHCAGAGRRAAGKLHPRR